MTAGCHRPRLQDADAYLRAMGSKLLHDLLGHPVVGPSWEGFVIEHLIAAAGWRCIPYYYRAHSGAEIDLLAIKAST